MQKHLLIKLETYETAEDIPIGDNIYFSFSFNDYMYFTSAINIHKKMPVMLNDHIVIPLKNNQDEVDHQISGNYNEIPDHIQLNRWQDHMIMFTHSIDISDLKTRVSVRKKYQTHSGQIFGFLLNILNPGQIQFGNKYIESISQHYLTIQNFRLHKAPKKTQKNPHKLSYIQIKTSSNLFDIPVMDGQICLKLPQTLQFMHIIDGQIASKSRLYTSDELRTKQMNIQLQSVSDLVNDQNISIDLQWGINLQQEKPITNLLLEAHQIMLYDIQLKLESTNDITNGRLKIIYGNKGFEAHNFEGSASKILRIKRIVSFMIKSEDEQFHIVLEKNGRVLSAIKIYTQDISIFSVVNMRRKFLGTKTNKGPLGSIKFKCQKGKNLSHPNNNRYWKQCLNMKKRIPSNSYLLSIQQISVKNQQQQFLDLVIKSQSQSSVVKEIPNFHYFDPNAIVDSVPYIFTVRDEQSIYMMLKTSDCEQYSDKSQDFLGIALLNFNELRLGMNSLCMPFYLNHKQTGTLQCLINKIAPFQFVKSIFQPQLAEVHRYDQKTINIWMQMKRIKFYPYFYTYEYDNKNQLYCIVEINRLKKVLILSNQKFDQNYKSSNPDLYFNPTNNSDKLNFVIDQTQFIKIKVTFLVSDLGREEQIYGIAHAKIKTNDIFPELGENLKDSPKKKKQNKQYIVKDDGTLIFKQVQISNSYGLFVGQVGFKVQKGAQISQSPKNSKQNINKSKAYISRTPQPEIDYKYKVQSSKIRQKINTGPFNSQIRRVQNDIDIINKNMQSIQKNNSPPKVQVVNTHTSHKKQQMEVRKLDRYHRDQAKQQYWLNDLSKKMRKNQKAESINPIRNGIINKSIDIRKDIRYDNSVQYGKGYKKRLSERQSVKLPSLKQPVRKGSLQQLVRMMQIRKKGRNGQYLQDETVNSSKKNASHSTSKKPKKIQTQEIRQTNQLEKIQRQNPNIKKNMAILFPQKNPKNKKQIKKQINSYEEKLKGLKSVLGEISQDMDEIEPDINQRNDRYQERQLQKNKEFKANDRRQEPINLQSAEFQDNQFALEMDI